MEIGKLLKMAELSGETDKNTLGMILSNRMDMASEQGGMISVKNFDALADDLVLWKKAALVTAEMAIDYYRSAASQSRSGIKPKFVPCMVRLYGVAMGDYPFHGTRAPAGDYDCVTNQYGAVSITATDGQLLGLRLNEFEPIAWMVNSKA